MKKQLLRAAASTVLGLSLTTGFAAADISNTGPGSDNTVVTKVSSHYKVNNDNNLGVSNSNGQSFSTSDAKVKGNTTGGSATSGNASNSNSSSFTLNVSN